MQIVAYVFIIIWLSVSLMGAVNPQAYFQRFSSLAKVLGIDPDQLRQVDILSCRIINVFLTTFCVFILYNLLVGKVMF